MLRWWTARLAKCHYQLGLLRDAERHFSGSLKAQDMVLSTLELCKVYLRLDQPNKALRHYSDANERHPGDVSLMLGIARVHDAAGELEKGMEMYKQVRNLPFYERLFHSTQPRR